MTKIASDHIIKKIIGGKTQFTTAAQGVPLPKYEEYLAIPKNTHVPDRGPTRGHRDKKLEMNMKTLAKRAPTTSRN